MLLCVQEIRSISWPSASEMNCIVSSGALNSTHSLLRHRVA